MLSLHGVLNLFVYQRLLVKKRPITDDYKQPELDPVEKRISLAFASTDKAEMPRRSNSCPADVLRMNDQPEFSIFDGTNASEAWGKFIIESSDCDEDTKLYIESSI